VRERCRVPRQPGSNIGLRRPRSEHRGLYVHSGTAPFSPGAYSYGMQLVSLEAVLATIWVSAVLICGLTGNLNSPSSWAVLASFAVVAPIVMMWRWNGPGQTMSESILEARR